MRSGPLSLVQHGLPQTLALQGHGGHPEGLSKSLAYRMGPQGPEKGSTLSIAPQKALASQAFSFPPKTLGSRAGARVRQVGTWGAEPKEVFTLRCQLRTCRTLGAQHAPSQVRSCLLPVLTVLAIP